MIRWSPLLLALGGCIAFEEEPQGEFILSESQAFAEACEAESYDSAVGCVATCGVGASPSLGIELALFRHIGAGAGYSARQDAEPFDARCGQAEWRQCVENTFGGLQCERRYRDYCATCTGAGVVLADKNGYRVGRLIVPGAVIEASALPAMMSGRFVGESGSCLAACIAAVSRRPCAEGCDSGEGCLETAFGDVCHPVGPLPSGAACHGPQDCVSLGCTEGACD